ncbi:MAG: NAD-dependent epimerase/dehydratase family protein [Desulfatibacillaceae bacterium]
MPKKKRSVLVTGVGHAWGRKLVHKLEGDPRFDPIIGIDFKKPRDRFERMEFFQVDLHNPQLAELLQVARVDTVCHLLFLETYSGNEEYFDQNVMGAMDLLAACVAAEIPRVILMSDTKVYGASYLNPTYLGEDTEIRGGHRHRYIQDRVEMERMLDRHIRQHARPRITILRFANIIGNTVRTHVTRYLDSEVIPTVIGYDPLVQFTHEDDVVEALYHTVKKQDAVGVFNIAGDGVLPLSQAMRIGGRIPLPVPATLLRLTSTLLRPKNRKGLTNSIPMEAEYLMHSCLGDTTRMREVLEFRPRYTSRQAVDDFYQHVRLGKYLPPDRGIRSNPEASERLARYIDRLRGEKDRKAEILRALEEGEGNGRS